MGDALNRGTCEGAQCESCPFSTQGGPTRPVFSEYPDDPLWIVIGEGPGFHETKQGRPFCLVPESRVLMADLTWKPIGEIVVGDKILSVDEHSNKGEGASGAQARRWHVATVTATYRRVDEVIAVNTSQGVLKGSADHPVLVRNGRSWSTKAQKSGWLPIGKLLCPGKTGRSSRITFLSKPWEQNKSYEAAWLAGFLDGEGHVLGSRPRGSAKKRKKDCKVGFTQNAGPTYERAASMVNALGYALNSKNKAEHKGVTCYRATIEGGLSDTLRFLGEVRPERLITNLQTAIENKCVRNLGEAKVISKEKLGRGELVDITTTTGTFIAEGFVVHNCGASGQVVNQILHKIGRPRDQLFVGNATLCQPPQGSPVEERERAAACCKPRLMAELAQFPGKPVLTLGAVAARAILPKESLDAIDPPDVPKTRKKSQKEKQKAARKDAKKETAAIGKIAERRFKKLLKIRKEQLKHEVIRIHHRKPDRAYLENETRRDHNQLWVKATAEANVEFYAKQKERALAKQAKVGTKKSTKKKPIKITDIVGTLFDVDVDGSGVRPVIPAIHPAALLRGGGATIGGSHTPDMAFINIIYDAGKVDALSKGKDVRLKLDVEYELTDPERAAQLFLGILQECLEDNQATIDLETYVDDVDRHHALMAYVAKIRVIGISSKRRRISVVWDLLPSWCLSYFQFVLGKVVTVYHNGLYDRTVIRAYGFILPTFGVDDCPNWEDTLLAHHAAFPGNAHNLQVVTSQFYGIPPWKSTFRNQDETLDKLAVYNGLDTGGTQALVSPLLHWVKKTKTERIYELDKRMSDIASRMHLAGIPIDREVNSQLVRTFTRLAKDSKDAVEAQARDPKTLENVRHHLALQLAQKRRKKDVEDFEERYNVRLADTRTEKWNWKINNSKHIASLLQAMGVPLIQTTEGGAVSTKKSVLESLVDHPIVQNILTYRQNNKMLDFVWPIFDRIDGGKIIQYGFADENDRIHPIWSIHKISGRWAASEPFGISNAPREKPKEVKAADVPKLPKDTIILEVLCDRCGKAPGKDHKDNDADHPYRASDKSNVIIAYRPTTKRQVVAPKGRKLVGFDFAQLEARILALISGDPFMCDVFAKDGDLHTECARDVFPGFDQKSPKERKMARTVCKTLEYATWYGASDDKVWKGLLQEGYTFKFQDVVGSLNVLRKKMAGIVRWQRETIQKASQPPYELRDFVGGRRRVWPMGQVEPSEALNIVPQATGSAIMNMGMFKMDQRLPKYLDAFAIAQIHDAAVFECDEDDAEPIAKDIDECFAYEHTNPENGKTVRFPVEVEIGDAWSDV